MSNLRCNCNNLKETLFKVVNESIEIKCRKCKALYSIPIDELRKGNIQKIYAVNGLTGTAMMN